MSENKIKTLPWRIDANNPRKIVSDNIHGFEPLTGENVIGGASEHLDSEIHANAMVTAVNNTYGCGVNPEAVPDLLYALERMIDMGGYLPHGQGQDSLEEGFPERFEKAKAAIDKAKLI